MAEIERPALGSPEAAVRSMVNLIATAARVDEEQLAYWLDAYYQLRAAYEHADEAEPLRPAVPPDLEILEALSNKLDRVADQVEKSMGIINTQFLQISGQLLNAADDKPSSGAARHLPPEEGNGESKELPPAIMKSSRVLPSADQAAIQSKKRTRSQEAAAADKSQRAYKIRVADRLRQVRAKGVTTAQIVEAGHGSVPDGAVLGIVGGEFRPIEDYRAIEAALDTLETK